VLTGLISVIFAQILLGEDVRNVAAFTCVGVFIVANAIVSRGLARRGRARHSMLTELVGMMAVNFGIIFVLGFAQRVLDIKRVNPLLATTLFFVFLFTLITVLFDRYHTVLRARGVLASRRPLPTGDPSATPVEA